MSKSDASQNNAFEVKEPHTAFEEFSSSEINRLRKTEPDFDEESYARARKLVLTRLEDNEQERT